MELQQQIQELTRVLPALPPRDVAFASSLINQFHRNRGFLSVAQIPHVAILISIAKGENTKTVGDFAGVISLFKSASAKLKYPKIRISVNGTPIVLSVAGERSSAPGSINVAGEGSFGDRAWYGRVSPDGKFDPSRSITPQFSAALIPVLQELSSNPIAAVQRYGKLTGNCMFCGARLSDPRSKVAGFGEICSEHWGLHEQWKTAVKNGPVPVTAVV